MRNLVGVFLVLVASSCSLLRVPEPTHGYQPPAPPACESSRANPIVDTVIAALCAGGAVAGLSGQLAQETGPNAGAAVGGVLCAALFTTSAVLGYGRTSECAEQEQTRRRFLDDQRQRQEHRVEDLRRLTLDSRIVLANEVGEVLLTVVAEFSETGERMTLYQGRILAGGNAEVLLRGHPGQLVRLFGMLTSLGTQFAIEPFETTFSGQQGLNLSIWFDPALGVYRLRPN